MLFMSKQSKAPSSDALSAFFTWARRSFLSRSMLTRSSQSTPIRPKVLSPITTPYSTQIVQAVQVVQNVQSVQSEAGSRAKLQQRFTFIIYRTVFWLFQDR